MEGLPRGLTAQESETNVQRWQLGRRSIYLTQERLIVDDQGETWAAARLADVSSVQIAPSIQASQRTAGWVLFWLGFLGGLYGLAMPKPPNGGAGPGTWVLVVGAALLVAGLALLLTALRPQAYITIASGEHIALVPRGKAQAQRVAEIMAAVGDAMVRSSGGQ